MKHETVYLTPEQLGITAAEHAGLLALAGDLAAGRVPHERDVPGCLDECEADPPRAFNMNHWRCGTAACIGGTLAWRLGKQHYDLSINALRPLFYPLDYDNAFTERTDRWEAITPAQAARAILNFLASGDPRWEEAVPA